MMQETLGLRPAAAACPLLSGASCLNSLGHMASMRRSAPPTHALPSHPSIVPLPHACVPALSPFPTGMSRAKVYADVNVKRPREYWDYENLTITWGCVRRRGCVCVCSALPCPCVMMGTMRLTVGWRGAVRWRQGGRL